MVLQGKRRYKVQFYRYIVSSRCNTDRKSVMLEIIKKSKQNVQLYQGTKTMQQERKIDGGKVTWIEAFPLSSISSFRAPRPDPGRSEAPATHGLQVLTRGRPRNL